MKKLSMLSGAALAALLTGSALAADMLKAPPPPPACANFGGFYGGGHVDAVQLNSYLSDQDGYFNNEVVGDTAVADYSRTNDGGTGGLEVGWNWQTHCSGWGVVADWSWGRTNIDTTLHPNLAAAIPFLTSFNETVSSSLKWYGTLRGKTGIVVDNVMLYVTGGLAWAKFSYSGQFNITNTAGVTVTSAVSWRDTKWGWVAGVGGEYAFTPNFSIFSELLYLSFPKRDYTVLENFVSTPIGAAGGNCPGVPGRCSFQTGENVIVARLGANWHLN